MPFSNTPKIEATPEPPAVADTAADSPELVQDPAEDKAPRYLKENDTAIALAWRVVLGRYRAICDKASRNFMRRTLRIGISARIFHPEPGGVGLRSKNLQYLEESIAQWVMSRDVLVFMIPTVNTGGLLHPSNITLRHYARHLDGLVLQGGADVSTHPRRRLRTQKRAAAL